MQSCSYCSAPFPKYHVPVPPALCKNLFTVSFVHRIISCGQLRNLFNIYSCHGFLIIKSSALETILLIISLQERLSFTSPALWPAIRLPFLVSPSCTAFLKPPSVSASRASNQPAFFHFQIFSGHVIAQNPDRMTCCASCNTGINILCP